jgi:vancomycin resistance protein VanJ
VRLIRWAAHAVRACIVLGGLGYATGVAVFLSLRLLPGGTQYALHAGWVQFLDTFTLYLLLLGLALLPVGLLLRSRSLLAGASIPLFALAFLYGELFIPPTWRPAAWSHPAGKPAAVLTVMTFNTAMGNTSPDHILRLVAQERPDMIALQELTPVLSAGLARALATDYPWQVLAPEEDHSGVGVLSRYPIPVHETFHLGPSEHLAQHVVLDIDGTAVHLLNVHLGTPRLQRRAVPVVSPEAGRLIALLRRIPLVRAGATWLTAPAEVLDDSHDLRALVRRLEDGRIAPELGTSLRRAHIQALLTRVRAIDAPLIVVGDFNMVDQNADYRLLTQYLHDSYRAAGYGFGHTFPRPGAFYFRSRRLVLPLSLVRIDYIFTSGHWRALEAHVNTHGGSDHLAVLARLALYR